jgi:hypothetical protein
MRAGQTLLWRGSLLATAVAGAAAAAVVIAVSAFAVTPAANAGLPRVIAFATPVGDVNCAVTSAPPTIPAQSLVCTAPKGYIVMGATGAAKLITWNKPFSPLGGQPATTLKAGSRWMWNAINCSISWWTVTCTNGPTKFTEGKAPATPNSVPLLGSGGAPRVGFGTSQPAEVSFGGDPTGMFKHIGWSHWGYATAIGSGDGYYDPPNAPTSASVPTRVILTASSLGVCHGKLAYRELAVTFVYKGHDEPGSKQVVCG